MFIPNLSKALISNNGHDRCSASDPFPLQCTRQEQCQTKWIKHVQILVHNNEFLSLESTAEILILSKTALLRQYFRNIACIFYSMHTI